MTPYLYNKQKWKLILLLVAMMIGIASLLYTNYLVKSLSESERTKARVWALSTSTILTVPDMDDQFISFVYQVRDSLTLPAIITDENDNIIFWRDLDSTKTNVRQPKSNLTYDPVYFKKELLAMQQQHEPIILNLDTEQKWHIFYHESDALRQLRIFPYIQIALITLFLIIAYTIFNSIRKSEQNLVWVGMAKEAAHQLGTPISSLMGWIELLKFKAGNDATINEMERDVQRLEIVADRFSKIGSIPSLSQHNIYDVVENYVNYFKVRTSDKISFILEGDKEAEGMINIQLFDWIIENLLKNAVNAIDTEGKITIAIKENLPKEEIFIDITDTGKGIPRSNFEKIFQPGYTTRKRGWGLGLSLTKRMIEYHKGSIFVKESELGKGTTFRIILKNSINNETAKE